MRFAHKLSEGLRLRNYVNLNSRKGWPLDFGGAGQGVKIK